MIFRRTVATDKLHTAHVRVARYTCNLKSLSATRANPFLALVQARLDFQKWHEENTLPFWFTRISRIVATRAIAAMFCTNHNDINECQNSIYVYAVVQRRCDKHAVFTGVYGQSVHGQSVRVLSESAQAA